MRCHSKKSSCPARRLSCLVPTNEAKPQDSLKPVPSNYGNGIANDRPLYAGRLAVYAGLFVVKYIGREPQPPDSWDEAENH